MVAEQAPTGIADFLPPAIGPVADVSSDDGDVEAPKPRRRVRRVRVEDNDEGVAPAA